VDIFDVLPIRPMEPTKLKPEKNHIIVDSVSGENLFKPKSWKLRKKLSSSTSKHDRQMI
jgi:hypothetical protein